MLSSAVQFFCQHMSVVFVAVTVVSCCRSSHDLSICGQVDEAVVEKLHTQYYNAVEGLFLKYKSSFPQYSNVKLVMER